MPDCELFAAGSRLRIFDCTGQFFDDTEVVWVKEGECAAGNGYVSLSELCLRSLHRNPERMMNVIFVVELGWRIHKTDPKTKISSIDISPEAQYFLELIS